MMKQPKSQKSTDTKRNHVFQESCYFCACINDINLSHLMGKPTMWFPNSTDTNQAVQSQKQARSMKFQI